MRLVLVKMQNANEQQIQSRHYFTVSGFHDHPLGPLTLTMNEPCDDRSNKLFSGSSEEYQKFIVEIGENIKIMSLTTSFSHKNRYFFLTSTWSQSNLRFVMFIRSLTTSSSHKISSTNIRNMSMI
jgi:hypothetical protein